MSSCTRAWLWFQQPRVMYSGCFLIPSLYMPILSRVLALRGFAGFTSRPRPWYPRVLNCRRLIHGLWIREQTAANPPREGCAFSHGPGARRVNAFFRFACLQSHCQKPCSFVCRASSACQQRKSVISQLQIWGTLTSPNEVNTLLSCTNKQQQISS